MADRYLAEFGEGNSPERPESDKQKKKKHRN